MNKPEIEEIKNLATGSSFPGITMHRMYFQGRRSYVMMNPFRMYSGLTGALGAVTFKGDPDAKRIDKWRDSMINQLGSIEKQEAYLNTMADFGTLVHETLVNIRNDGALDWGQMNDYAEHYFEASARKNGIQPNPNVISRQVFDFNKAAASMLQYVYENVHEILAIEVMVKSESLQIATPVDLVYRTKNMDIHIVNVKTSGQISDHQIEQASMELLMWNETYPELKAKKTGIVRSKDWNLKKGVPTYEDKMITVEEANEIIKGTLPRLQIGKDLYANFPTSVGVFVGTTKLGESPKIENVSMEKIFTDGLCSVTETESEK